MLNFIEKISNPLMPLKHENYYFVLKLNDESYISKLTIF